MLTAVIRTIGLPACAVALLLVYYEGLPGASRIPFLSSIPVVGDLLTGRVHSYALPTRCARRLRIWWPRRNWPR
jgi:hypothetical protein